MKKIKFQDKPIDMGTVGMAVVSGLLSGLAFPKAGLSFLIFVAFIPFLFSISDFPAKKRFRIGILAGMTHNVIIMYGIVYTLNVYGHLPLFLSIPVLLLLSFYLSLYTAFFAVLTPAVCSSPAILPIAVPTIWVTFEYLRAILLSGFPWEFAGHSQWKNLYLIQMSDLFGVYGISFVIILVNCVGFLVLASIRKKKWFGVPVSMKTAGVWTVLCLVMMGTVFLYGYRRIASVDERIAHAPSLKTAVVQGNISQDIKWDPDFRKATTEKYIRLSKALKPEHPDLVVWPETATPFFFTNHGLTFNVLSAVRETGMHFLIGSPSFQRQGAKTILFNSAFLIKPGGTVFGKYDKAHLVPFGEYVPFQDYIHFIDKLVEQVGNFQKGEPGKVLWMDHVGLGVQICYEIIFPELTRSSVRNGAEIILNLTNDAWYGTTSIPWQHFSLSVFRAVETRRSLVRCANTGFSGFVDPTGRIPGMTKLYREETLAQDLPLLKEKTPYVRIGDLFAQVCLGLTIVGTLWIMIRKRRRNHVD